MYIFADRIKLKYMDVTAFWEAQNYPILKDWVMDKDGAQIREALRIVKTQQFQNWYKANPKGTMDQYLALLQQQRLEYVNSPQYQFMVLRNQLVDANIEIDKLQENLNDKNEQIESLQENLDDKNEQIESLSESISHYRIAMFNSLILLLAYILFIKRSSIHMLLKRLTAQHTKFKF